MEMISYVLLRYQMKEAVHIYAVLTGFASIGFGKLTMEIVI